MSYKKKKMKKGFINQLKRRAGLIKIALLKKYKSYIQKNNITMQQRQTRNIMQWLRERARIIRENNQRVNEWVDSYIDSCILAGRPVEILTQYCLSKDLEKRYIAGMGQFLPLPAEIDLFTKQIPAAIEMFKNNNVAVNWFVTFNDSYIEQGRVSEEVTTSYTNMIAELVVNSDVLLLNWEKDVLNEKPKPNQDILSNFFSFISRDAFDVAMNDLIRRTQNQSNFKEIKTGFDDGLKFKIACEAEEGRALMQDDLGLFKKRGEFILAPLELVERYVFFGAVVPDFQKRIVSMLKPYPWRMDVM